MFRKSIKIINRLHKNEQGITGLETAIILIAFVTVAAVFGFAVLSDGLFSAERSKETVYAGLQQAKSSLELAGSVMVISTDNTSVSTIVFNVRNTISGQPIDMTPCDGTDNATNKCTISLLTPQDHFSDIKWTKLTMGSADDDNLLEVGEQFEIRIDTADLGDGKALTSNLEANVTFSIQIKPNLGSTINIKRTLPAEIDPVMDLY
jgi:flagellin FlaB